MADTRERNKDVRLVRGISQITTAFDYISGNALGNRRTKTQIDSCNLEKKALHKFRIKITSSIFWRIVHKNQKHQQGIYVSRPLSTELYLSPLLDCTGNPFCGLIGNKVPVPL